MSADCRNCPICHLSPTEEDRLGTVEVNHHNRANLARPSYELLYCACGDLIYLSPTPSHADILAMYAETAQFSEENPTSEVYRGQRAANVLEYITSSLASLMRLSGLLLTEPFRVLEVGAGLAWMCRAAKMMDWSNVTIAQDLSTETIEECRWVDQYVVEDLLKGTTVDAFGPFDVISMTHVFEHLEDPVAMLQRQRGLLSERGLIFITAPSRPPGWRRGSDLETWHSWSYHHVPAHLQYFSEGSLARAAHAANLDLVLWKEEDGGQAFEAWLSHPGAYGRIAP